MKKYSLALVTCICLFTYPAITYAEQDVPAPITVTAKSKKQLARELLMELDIGKQYDLFFWNSVDIGVHRGSKKEFKIWLQQTMARLAGWKYVESQYVTSFATAFSEEELQELLVLAKKPLMKKLLRSQIQAYEDTGEKRAGLLWKFWEDYNDGNVGTHLNFLN